MASNALNLLSIPVLCCGVLVRTAMSAASVDSSRSRAELEPRRGQLHRVIFFYDVYAFTNEELWYGVQWKDLSCSEMKLDELQQHAEHQALLDAYRKSSIPWRESHGYSIVNRRLRFDASTAKQLDDVRRRPAKVRRLAVAVPAAASRSISPSPMEFNSDDEGYSLVDVDDYVPLSYLARFHSPRRSPVEPVAADAQLARDSNSESDAAAEQDDHNDENASVNDDAPLSSFVH